MIESFGDSGDQALDYRDTGVQQICYGAPVKNKKDRTCQEASLTQCVSDKLLGILKLSHRAIVSH